jgi:iron(III) transport system substrate-binding protein
MLGGRVGRGVAALILFVLATVASAAQAAEEVNVYSYRQPFLIQPMFDAFTRDTGIKVNVVFANKGLVERLKAEGRNSPADLIFTVDIGRLADAVDGGVTQAVKNDMLESVIPASMRDPEGHWFAVTQRARVIYASKDRVPLDEARGLSYADLADPKWRGRICTRAGDHAYNVALFAAILAKHGEAHAKAWMAGLRDNLARKPQGNDRAQVKAIMEGQCDLALGNHYYYALMLQNEEQSAWAASANIIFPDQAGDGAHMNVSGIAMTRAAPNRENAVKLMEFLVGELAQKMYAEQNNEYPLRAGVEPSGLLQSFGDFKRAEQSLADVAAKRAAAIKLVNEVQYNAGPSS